MGDTVERIISSGTSGVDDSQEVQRIRIGNLLTGLIVVIGTVYVFVLGALAGLTLGAATAAVVALFAGLLRTSAAGWTRLSRFGFVLLLAGVITVYGALLGEGAGVHFMFFPILVLPPLIFGPADRALFAVSVLLPIAGLTLLVLTDFDLFGPPILGVLAQRVVELTLVATSAVTLLTGVLYFARATERAQTALDARNREMKGILDNVDQGLLVVDRDGVVADQRSAAVDRWFGEVEEGAAFSDLLARIDPVAARRVAVAWGREGDDVAVEQLPGEARHGVRFFDLRYHPVGDRVGWSRMLVVVTDVTEAREREAQRAREQAHNEQQAVERARVDEQLHIARQLQKLILPRDTEVPGIDIAYEVLPADLVGGDYLDVLPCQDGAWVAVGDVSGHGIGAGMTMFMVQSAMSALCRQVEGRRGGQAGLVQAELGQAESGQGERGLIDDRRPSAVVKHLNDVLYENIRVRREADDYITFVAALVTCDGKVRYSGGHLDILVKRRTGELEVVHTRGAWIGAFPTIDHALFDDELALDDGDMIVLYTDGVTEARNGRGEQFGPDRLHSIVREAGDGDPRRLRDAVIDAVRRWSDDVPADDVTILTLRYSRGVGAMDAHASTTPA